MIKLKIKIINYELRKGLFINPEQLMKHIKQPFFHSETRQITGYFPYFLGGKCTIALG